VTTVWTVEDTAAADPVGSMNRPADGLEANRADFFKFELSKDANEAEVRIEVMEVSTLFAVPRNGMSFDTAKVTCKELCARLRL